MGAKCEDHIAEFFEQVEIWRSMAFPEEIVKSLDFGEKAIFEAVVVRGII